MTDFIITMLMITLLNVLVGSAVFAAFIWFTRDSDKVKESNITINITIKNNIESINIKEYPSDTIIKYLSMVDIIPTMPVETNEKHAFYATRKIKRHIIEQRSQKVHKRVHRDAYTHLANFTLKEYCQTADDFKIQEAPLELERITVPC